MGGVGGAADGRSCADPCCLNNGLRGGSRVVGKGGSDKYIHNWGRVREGACPLP